MSIAPFDDLVERLALSSRDWDRIRKVRASLSDLLSEAFHNVPGFCGVTYIGSTESGCALKWGYDIDCVIGLTPFTRSAFVDGLSSLDHHFDGLRFRDASHIVPAIATTYFRGEKLGIVGVDPSRMDTCEGDVWQHGAFTRRHLRRQLHRDVLLAKAFFRALNIPKKAVGCGFAVEQMIAHCGGFIELLRVFAAGEPMVIDYSGK